MSYFDRHDFHNYIYLWTEGVDAKASLSGDFMSLFLIHPDFEISAEEFHPHETLSIPMKLLSHISSLI
jgi:hypothetical protein